MRIVNNIYVFTVLLLLSICNQFVCFAQCTNPIAVFPYNEDFENANNGNWVSQPSGAWQCGTLSTGKQVIVTPGGGQKSWIVGGLTGSTYANGNSSLQSPCFDFSSLTNPEITFSVFWETERRFDGCTFQYSLDGGNSFTTLGTINSNSTCLGVNWFTFDPITYLNGEPGWSGNIQTGGGGGGNCFYGLGSGRWVTARHNMSMLGGRPSVIFRFYFGAGTQCNDFDGFAVDDIHIGEAPPPGVADFSHTCVGSIDKFINYSDACSVLWDFGDPTSQSNTSTDLNPTHVYDIRGVVYTVTLTAFFASGLSDTKTLSVNVPGYDQSVLNLNKCKGEFNNSFAIINLGQASNEYIFSWNSNPVQNTATVSNLPGGNYSCIVSTPTGCPSTAVFDYIDPPILDISTTIEDAKCVSDNGSIVTAVSGGESPYFYNWNTIPAQQTSAINNLSTGFYDLDITDNKGCVKSLAGLEVKRITYPVNVFLGNTTRICPGQSLLLNPGSFASYVWQDNSTVATYSVKNTGTYSVDVKDANGCTGSGSIDVLVDCKGIYFPSAFTPGYDPLNAGFGAIGDLTSLRNYSIVIYNRYAQIVFSSSDPFKKWDGTFKGKAQDTQCFIWTAEYTVIGQPPVFKKGTILIIR